MIKGTFCLSLCVSASCLSATREQTEMGMREGAAQGHPDNREWYAESLFHYVSVYFTLTGNKTLRNAVSYTNVKDIVQKYRGEMKAYSLLIQMPVIRHGMLCLFDGFRQHDIEKVCSIPLRIYTFQYHCLCQIMESQEAFYQGLGYRIKQCIPVDYILTCRQKVRYIITLG